MVMVSVGYQNAFKGGIFVNDEGSHVLKELLGVFSAGIDHVVVAIDSNSVDVGSTEHPVVRILSWYQEDSASIVELDILFALELLVKQFDYIISAVCQVEEVLELVAERELTLMASLGNVTFTLLA